MTSSYDLLSNFDPIIGLSVRLVRVFGCQPWDVFQRQSAEFRMAV